MNYQEMIDAQSEILNERVDRALREKVFIEVALRTMGIIAGSHSCDWNPANAERVAEEILSKAKEFKEKK